MAIRKNRLARSHLCSYCPGPSQSAVPCLLLKPVLSQARKLGNKPYPVRIGVITLPCPGTTFFSGLLRVKVSLRSRLPGRRKKPVLTMAKHSKGPLQSGGCPKEALRVMTCLESSLNQNPRERLCDREGQEDGLGSSDFGAFYSEWGSREPKARVRQWYQWQQISSVSCSWHCLFGIAWPGILSI